MYYLIKFLKLYCFGCLYFIREEIKFQKDFLIYLRLYSLVIIRVEILNQVFSFVWFMFIFLFDKLMIFDVKEGIFGQDGKYFYVFMIIVFLSDVSQNFIFIFFYL